MKWRNKLYEFENEILKELDELPKIEYDISEGYFYYQDYKNELFQCLSVYYYPLIEEFNGDIVDLGMWMITFKNREELIFNDIEDVLLKVDVIDYLLENYRYV